MIEILLIIFQCKRAKELLTEKGYQDKSIYFSIVLTWFTITLLGSAAIALVYYIVTNDDSDPSWILCYLPTIPLGYLSSHLILKRIDSYPYLEDGERPQFRTPVWHYIVCVLLMLLGLYAVLAFLVILGSSPEDLDSKQQEYVDSLGVLSFLATVGLSALSGFAGFLLLFRLSIGFILYCLSFFGRVSYQIYSDGFLFFIPEPFSIARLIGSIVAYAIPITLIMVWSKWWSKNLI